MALLRRVHRLQRVLISQQRKTLRARTLVSVSEPAQDSVSNRVMTQPSLRYNSYPCGDCTKTFAFRRALDDHCKHNHTKSWLEGLDSDVLSPDGDEEMQEELIDTYVSGRRSGNRNGPVSTSSNERYFCPVCEEGFHRRTEMIAHRNAHEEFMSVRCVTCGDVFAGDKWLARHLARLPVHHASADSYRSFDTSAETLLSQFSGYQPVIQNAMHHTTTVESRGQITEANFLAPSTLSLAAFVGPQNLLQSDSDGSSQDPAHLLGQLQCAYFSVTPASKMSIPIVSHHPRTCEPGELTSKLVVDLDTFLHSPERYKMFYVGTEVSQNGKITGTNAHVVLLLARESDWPLVESCGRSLVELDIASNAVLYHTTSGWYVCSSLNIESQRPPLVSVAVLGGLDLRDAAAASVRWMDTSKSYFGEGQSPVCPICELQIPTFANLMEHITVVHEERNFTCGFCPKEFQSLRAKKRHLNVFHAKQNARGMLEH